MGSSIARGASQIIASFIVVAGVADVSPVALVKRTAIPMLLALISAFICSMIF